MNFYLGKVKLIFSDRSKKNFWPGLILKHSSRAFRKYKNFRSSSSRKARKLRSKFLDPCPTSKVLTVHESYYYHKNPYQILNILI